MTSLVSEKFVKSQTGRDVAVNVVAAGLRAKDSMVASYETLKEEVEDIKEEAIAKNNG